MRNCGTPAIPLVLALLLCSLAGACASASRNAQVVRLEDGGLASVSSAENEPDARMAALHKAEQYCDDRKQEPVFPRASLPQGQGKPRLDLGELPMIGKAFKGGDKTQVVLGFRCQS